MNTFQKVLFISAVLFFSYGCNNQIECSKISSGKPNIIFILVDDMGYGDLGVLFQNQRAKKGDRSEPWAYTPNLDIMAEEGALLTNQYCPAPVCAPSRASFLSGRSQGHSTVRDNQFDKALDENYTIASVMKSAGYATAAFGKWGLQGGSGAKADKHDWPAHPLNRGFDYFLGYMRHRDGHEHYPKEGVYRGKKEVWLNKTNIADKLDKCYTADLWAAGAKKWIIDQVNTKENKKPFFIFLAFDTPHAVMELATQPYPKGGGLKGGLQWLDEPGHMINTASGEVDSWTHPDYVNATYDDDDDPATPEVAWPKVYQRYASAIRRVDDAVGDIMQLLKDLCIDDNTMIVFSSDNGPSNESYLPKGYKPNNPSFFRSFGPFDGIKRDCLEGGVRMPVVAYWPGNIKKGTVVNAPSISYDWLPTFLEMANMPKPAIMDGVSLIPSLTGKGRQQKSSVYIEYNVGGRTPNYDDFAPQHRGRVRKQMQVIRFENYVGVRYDIKSAEDDFEIYDIVNDPQQLNNLASETGMAKIQEKMKAGVLQIRVPNKSAPRPYDRALIPAESIEGLKSGLSYSVYTEDFPWVPDVSTFVADRGGLIAKPDLNIFANKGGDVVLFKGYLNVPEDGEYTFAVSIDGKATLRIHQALVVDADYGYKPLEQRSGKIWLKAGMHPYRLTCLLNEGEKKELNFMWAKEDSQLKDIPASYFYH